MREFVSDTTKLTVLVGMVTLAIHYIVYLGRLRELRLTANERLMRMVIDIDKEVISHPELMWLMRPDEFPRPDPSDIKLNAQLRAFMYMHLNTFDVAFNYYNKTLGMTWFKRTFVLSHEELDHWKGWDKYMTWFVQLPFVMEVFQREAKLWYGPGFADHLLKLIAQQPAELADRGK